LEYREVVPSERANEVSFSPEEYRRYHRHLILPQIGEAGQARMKAAKALIVGCGGLGSPLGLYLAAAGVGTIGLVDFDRVDESNLQRQVAYGMCDVGKPKVEAAADRLRSINPHITIKTYDTAFTSANAMEIAADYDLVLDGNDNFPTRYLVNDVCVFLGIPSVYGSIYRFDGQVSVFWARRGPCYRCLYPEPPPPDLVPSCAEGGVLGVLPGVVGCLQATEAVKLITGTGESLIGRLIVFDALEMTFRQLKLRKNPDCPVCGQNPTITEPVDYYQFCGVPRPAQSGTDEALEPDDITVPQLREWMASGDPPVVIDVREPDEFEICRIPGTTLIPLTDLPQRLAEVPRNTPVVVHCKAGGRSRMAVDFLKQQGYTNLRNLAGGIDAWIRETTPE